MTGGPDSRDARPPSGVVAVVVHFGDATLTGEAVRSIAGGGITPDAIVVVDNGPGDIGTAALAEAAGIIPLEVITRSTNLGFAGGVQLAMQESAASTADFVWLLNNDATARPEALAALLNASRDAGEHALVSSVILEADGRLWFREARFYPWLGIARHRKREPHAGNGTADAFRTRRGWFSVPYLPACSLLVPRGFTQSVGGFDPAFFVYGEDVDLSIRAARAGWGLRVANESVVVHAASSGTSRRARERMQAATSLRLTERYFPLVLPVAVLASACIGVVRGMRARDPGLTAARLGGLKDGLASGLRRERA